jgi:hypothetical protein
MPIVERMMQLKAFGLALQGLMRIEQELLLLLLRLH